MKYKRGDLVLHKKLNHGGRGNEGIIIKQNGSHLSLMDRESFYRYNLNEKDVNLVGFIYI